MRKYQQLLLVIISVISVIILLFYRSENSRLKYVLQVVNFFGRNDASALVKVENTAKLLYPEHDYSAPLPAWQRLGNDFHGYSAFWLKGDFVTGGEIIVVGVGITNVTPKFKCSASFVNNHLISGKFGFTIISQNGSSHLNGGISLTGYHFICKISRDFGIPQQIILTNTESNERFLFYIRNTNDKKQVKQLMTSCVDLNEYNLTHKNDFHSNTNLMDFFIIHHLQGIDEFIAYGSHILDLDSKINLLNNGIRVNVLPYNFPFSIENNLNTIQDIIKSDCQLRNFNSAKYFLLQSPNEYIYINNVANEDNKSSFLTMLNGAANNGALKFQVKLFNVCIDESKSIFDNFSYDLKKNSTNFFIFNANSRTFIDNSKDFGMNSDFVFVIRYSVCHGVLPKTDYRNSVNHHFLHLINTIHSNTKKLVI